MAGEKYFSIEQTLLDLLGFFKRLVITSFRCVFRPVKIINDCYAIAADPDRIQHHTNHFLFFVICSLITMSYYMTILFNQVNHLTSTTTEVMLKSIKYLTNTPITEKLFTCLFFIGNIYLLVQLLTLVFRSAKTGWARFYILVFKRITYYFCGGMQLVILLPFLFKDIVNSETGTNDINNFFFFGYLIYILVGFFLSGELKQHGHKDWPLAGMTTLFAIAVISLIPTICKTCFRTELEFLGYLNFKPGIEVLNENSGDTLVFSSSSTDSIKHLSARVLIHNNGQSNILIPKDTVLKIVIQPVNSSSHKNDSLSFILSDSSAHELSTGINIPAGEYTLLNLCSGNIPATTLQQLLLRQKENKGSLPLRGKLFAIPVNNYDQSRLFKTRFITK